MKQNGFRTLFLIALGSCLLAGFASNAGLPAQDPNIQNFREKFSRATPTMGLNVFKKKNNNSLLCDTYVALKDNYNHHSSAIFLDESSNGVPSGAIQTLDGPFDFMTFTLDPVTGHVLNGSVKSSEGDVWFYYFRVDAKNPKIIYVEETALNGSGNAAAAISDSNWYQTEMLVCKIL